MDIETMNLIWVIGIIVIDILIGYWSVLKGRGFLRGFLFAFFLSPVAGFIYVALLSRQERR